MRLHLEDMIAELRLRIQEGKGLRNRVLLQQALKALQDYKKANERVV